MSEVYSYSKIDLYEQCPFKYKLKYVDKLSFYSDSIATEFGTLVHETEESIANCIRNEQPINYDELKSKFRSKMLELKDKYPKDYITKDKAGRTYEEKALSYLECTIYNLEYYMLNHPTYEIVGVEQEFSFDYNETSSFRGFIDRVFRDNTTNEYIIQDIKTYPVPVDSKKLETPLQFVVYAIAVTQLYNCTFDKIRCQYYLPLCDLTQDAGTLGYVMRGKDKINLTFAQIESTQFQPHPTPLCNYCEYCQTNPDATEDSKYLCPYYCEWDRATRNRYDIGKVENKWKGLNHHAEILEAYYKKYNINLTEKT